MAKNESPSRGGQMTAIDLPMLRIEVNGHNNHDNGNHRNAKPGHNRHFHSFELQLPMLRSSLSSPGETNITTTSHSHTRPTHKLKRRESFTLRKVVAKEESIPLELIRTPKKILDQNYFSIKDRFRKISLMYMRSNNMRIVILLAAIISCVLYIIDTYESKQYGNSETLFRTTIDVVIFVLFVVDYIFNLENATSRLAYIFGVQGILDLLSLFAIVNNFIKNTGNLSFLPLFRLFRVVKVLRLFEIQSFINVNRPTLPSASEAIFFEIMSLAIGIILALFLGASLLYTINEQVPGSFIFAVNDSIASTHFTWFDCLYIMFVMLSTLGFGDYVPFNALGRVFVIVTMGLALTVIPYSIGRLAETIRKKPVYKTEFKPIGDVPHIVLCANLNTQNFQQIITLLLSQGTFDSEVVESASPVAVLSTVMPSRQLQLLLLHPMNARKVHFFIGSPTCADDLRRVKAEQAVAIIMFADKPLEGELAVYGQDDYSTRLKVLSTVHFVNDELDRIALRGRHERDSQDNPIVKVGKNLIFGRVNYEKLLERPVIIAQAHSHDVCFSLLDSGVDRTISLVNMKYSLLAYGSMFPGFLAIFANLLTTIPARKSLAWKHEFDMGLAFELVEITVSEHCSEDVKKLTFSQLCRFLYQWSKGTIAVVGAYNINKQGVVILNPYRFAKIAECQSLFVICNDSEMTVRMLKTNNILSIMTALAQNAEEQRHGSILSAITPTFLRSPGNKSPRKNPVIHEEDEDDDSPERINFKRDGSCSKSFRHLDIQESRLIDELGIDDEYSEIVKLGFKRDKSSFKIPVSQSKTSLVAADVNEEVESEEKLSTQPRRNSTLATLFPSVDSNQSIEAPPSSPVIKVNKRPSSGLLKIKVPDNLDTNNISNTDSPVIKTNKRPSAGTLQLSPIEVKKSDSESGGVIITKQLSSDDMKVSDNSDKLIQRPSPRAGDNMVISERKASEFVTVEKRDTESILAARTRSGTVLIKPPKPENDNISVPRSSSTSNMHKEGQKKRPSFISESRTLIPEAQAQVYYDFNEMEAVANHVVVVCAYSPHYPITRMIPPIESFIAATRTRSMEELYILATNAELIETQMRKRAHEKGDDFDSHTKFITGIPNSSVSLQKCFITKARCIVIIGHENDAQVNDGDESAAGLNTDLYVILAALEIGTIFDNYKQFARKSLKEFVEPIVIMELFGNTTINISTRGKGSLRSWEKHKVRVPVNRMSLVHDPGISTNGYETDSVQESLDEASSSWESAVSPMHAQGRILQPGVLDCLTIQMLYNPHELEFWQVMMGMQKKANLLGEEDSTTRAPPAHRLGGHLGQGTLEKFAIPPGFKGTFGKLFDLLLSSFGSVAIALYREESEASPAYVAILPPEDIVILPTDKVFTIVTSTQNQGRNRQNSMSSRFNFY